MSNEYHPKIDISPELNPTDADFYQTLIGILQWMDSQARVCRH